MFRLYINSSEEQTKFFRSWLDWMMEGGWTNYKQEPLYIHKEEDILQETEIFVLAAKGQLVSALPTQFEGVPMAGLIHVAPDGTPDRRPKESTAPEYFLINGGPPELAVAQLVHLSVGATRGTVIIMQNDGVHCIRANN